MLAETATFNVRGDRAVFPPLGLHGGGNGSFSAFFIDRADGSEHLPSKIGGNITRGQRLRIATPGGGGYGAPAERDRAVILEDYRNGKISAESIKQDYGVTVSE